MYEKNLKKFTINFCSLVNKNTTIEVIVPSIENKFQFSYGDNYLLFRINYLALRGWVGPNSLMWRINFGLL